MTPLAAYAQQLPHVPWSLRCVVAFFLTQFTSVADEEYAAIGFPVGAGIGMGLIGSGLRGFGLMGLTMGAGLGVGLTGLTMGAGLGVGLTGLTIGAGLGVGLGLGLGLHMSSHHPLMSPDDQLLPEFDADVVSEKKSLNHDGLLPHEADMSNSLNPLCSVSHIS